MYCVQLRVRLLVVAFYTLGIALLWYVKIHSCRSYMYTWYGLLPLQVSHASSCQAAHECVHITACAMDARMHACMQTPSARQRFLQLLTLSGSSQGCKCLLWNGHVQSRLALHGLACLSLHWRTPSGPELLPSEWNDVESICQNVQVVETGAAVTWSFFAMPATHLDDDMPALQVSSTGRAYLDIMDLFKRCIHFIPESLVMPPVQTVA